MSDEMRELLERLRRDSSDRFGVPPMHVDVLTCERRESSEVARVRVTSAIGDRYVFAKIVRPRPGEHGLENALNRFRRDFEVTSTLFDQLRLSSELRCVEPIAYYEDLLGLVTIEVVGMPFNKAIARDAAWPTAPSRLKHIEVASYRLGRWIAAFQHLAPNPEPTPLDLGATREYIDIRLKRLMAVPLAAFGESDRTEILAYFDRRASEVRIVDLIEVPVHGDIVPSNVIVGDDSVTVLDFGMTGRGSRYLDIARLYTQLHFYTAKPHYRPGVMQSLQRSALSGFHPELRDDDPLFEICAVQHVVCHLLSHARQPGSFPSSLYSRHQCQRHRRWLAERTRRSVRPEVGAGESEPVG